MYLGCNQMRDHSATDTLFGAVTQNRTEIVCLQDRRNRHYTMTAWCPYQESSLNYNLRRIACYPLHYRDIENIARVVCHFDQLFTLGLPHMGRLYHAQIWYPRRESNPHHDVRSVVFCPLNYKGKVGTGERNRTPISQ